MNNTTTEKSIDYNSCEILEMYSATPDLASNPASFFGDATQWTLSDGSEVFDVELAKQRAAAPDEKSATQFLHELQSLCKKHGIVFEESF